MANYAKYPMYPKPCKGTPTNTKNNYTTVVNSIIRPNVSYAQATTNNPSTNTSNSNNRQQMAPQRRGNPSIKTPTQASRVIAPPPQQVNVTPGSNVALINQTLQDIIQAFSTLAQQISMNFADNTPQPKNSKKSKQAKKRELHSLVEAIIDDDDE
ncbi:hypothetical protein TNIN_125131 [Trichonephila inaurata madagascariensis]|uniref:Uncharacterized protein n=1 Tax=Trichonephila inaurata madagascariensis TaxID=2747483 RepID=A0A8X6YY82_9ARAC|nr:hypothetical protein TNIN_125131 [Trichonephila inaurata madagascariensis]